MRKYLCSALLLVTLLAACSSSGPVELTLKLKAGDSFQYEVKETVAIAVVGGPILMEPVSETTGVFINVASADGSQASAECVLVSEKGKKWPVPVTLDTQTGATTIRDATKLGTFPVTMYYDHYMLPLGARPGKAQVKAGDRWQGEMRRIPLGVVLSDEVPLPLNLELVKVAKSAGRQLATVRMWGERELNIARTNKLPGSSVGTMSATGTMVIDIGSGLVDSSEVKVVTRLKNSWDGMETEGSSTIEVRHVGPAY